MHHIIPPLPSILCYATCLTQDNSHILAGRSTTDLLRLIDCIERCIQRNASGHSKSKTDSPLQTSHLSMNLANGMSLAEHAKILKAAMPIRQKSPERKSKLTVFKTVKTLSKKAERIPGIFSNRSFCFPILDEDKKLSDMIINIFHQGGDIVEFDEKMQEATVQYVVVSEKVPLAEVRQTVGRLVNFEKIIKYEYVLDCLKKLKKLDVAPYVLFDNTANAQVQITTDMAKSLLEAEELNKAYIRPKLQVKPSQKSGHTVKHERPEVREETVYKKFIQNDQQEKYVPVSSEQVEPMEEEKPEVSETNKAGEQTEQEIGHHVSSDSDIDENDMSNSDDQSEQHKEEEKPMEISNTVVSAHKQEIQTVEVLPQAGELEPATNPVNEQLIENDTKTQHPKYNKRQLSVEQKRVKKGSKQKKPQQQQQKVEQPQFLWQKKRDKRQFWYAPPKNLSSHNFQRNNFICSKLLEMSEMYKRNNDVRSFSYVRAVAIIKSHSKEILCADDIKEVKDLSKSMFQKVKEIIETGSIVKMQKFSNSEEMTVRKNLEKVWGVGPKKAKEFYNKGVKTVEDLRKRPELISKQMAVGLKYFDEFAVRIPRDKVSRIFQFVKSKVFEQVRSDKLHHVEVVGSYRRGRPTCGDIDVLICRHDGSVQRNLLADLISRLQEAKFMTESLSQPKPFDGHNPSAYMGVCFFEGKHHRIDIKHYPVEQYAFALMYFTGSDLFNRQMRMQAHNMGLLLSDHGISQKQRNGQSKIWKGGKIPIMRTEEEIFKFLEMKYCTPAEREI